MNPHVYSRIIDLVLPCYNPPQEWEKAVVANFVKLCELNAQHSFNLIIVTDGSTQGYDESTVAYLHDNIPSLRLIDYQPNRGKGYALRTAVAECQSELVLYIDYDFPYTWDSINAVIAALDRGADVVVAIRGEEYQQALPPLRKVLSYASHLVNKILFRLKITDTQGGMKGFNRAGREIFLTTTIDSFLFDTQFIYKATHTKGINLAAIDTHIKEGIIMSKMGFKVLRQEIGNIFVILRGK